MEPAGETDERAHRNQALRSYKNNALRSGAISEQVVTGEGLALVSLGVPAAAAFRCCGESDRLGSSRSR
jgi:hypothetical protein